MSDARRLQLSLLTSFVLNAAALALIALLWHWGPPEAVRHPPHIKLVRVALRHAPPPKPLAPPPPRVAAARPAPKPLPKPHPVTPKPLPKRRTPGAKVKTTSPAPPAARAGGSDAGSAAPPVPAPPPLHVAASEKPALLIIHNSPLPLPPLPTPSFAPGLVAAPPAPKSAPTASAGHGAAGADTAGRERGAGDGTSAGAGLGAGRTADAGEPFGVGKGVAGDGGPRHVVYVLDISGSMTSRIKRADAEIRKALAGLGPDETFDVIAFNIQNYEFGNELAPATPRMVRHASEFLDTLVVSDGTNLEGAMTAALAMPEVNEVVLLTDGVPTDGEQDFGKLARLIRRRNTHHARISCVGLVGKNPDGTDNSFDAATLLEQIARDSGGACVLVPLGVATP